MTRERGRDGALGRAWRMRIGRARADGKWCARVEAVNGHVLSRCPVLTIPTGLAKNNIPTGIQIVGKTFDDVSVFQAANNFERIDPWYENNKKRPQL